MKSLSIVLVTFAALALARDPPSDDELNRQAEKICGRLENINMDKCKSDAKDCVTSALDRKSPSEIENGDEVFWRHIRECTVSRNINGNGDSPKNFVAAFDDSMRFICEPPAKGNKMDCVFIFRKMVEKDCANRGCRFPRELPHFCAKLGGCEECEHGAGDKTNGGLEGKFPGAGPFFCTLRQNKVDTTQPAPLNSNQCNEIRMQKFTECRQSNPYDFDRCFNEGQDAFTKCGGLQ
ncbi:uncharacterized protein G6M90_00g084540 [Metarhizium brunneum]|uniref:Uncharacterized protein n=1 Tax=Metarhizium brunneum TaxID=500148 RepID=A0A7D5Z912_9HYPO|nr:hypothetical protein G6M90_00g084540 [Metarhizium brunneum]